MRHASPITGALVLAGLVVLAACGERQEAQAPEPTPEPLAGPLTYERTTSSAGVRLILPERAGRLPALYAQLYAQGRNLLDAFAEGATAELEELRAAGFPARPYEREIAYSVAAETPRLLSLRVVHYENTGGAHPNGYLEGLTWDKGVGRTLELADLFRPDADLSAADRALCEGLLAAKRERTGHATLSGEFDACPTLRATTATLAPSTVAERAAGLTVLFSPYQVGPYAEGAYEIVVPQATFSAALAPAYAAEFAGTPAPQAEPPPPG